MTKAEMPKGLTRVETGPVRFGDDWPGLFLRGDECIFLMQTINTMLGKSETTQIIEDLIAHNHLQSIAKMINEDVLIHPEKTR